MCIAWLLSHRKNAIPWRIVGWGLALQFGIGLILLPTFLQIRVIKPLFNGFLYLFGLGQSDSLKGLDEIFFSAMRTLVQLLNNATTAGSEFVFGKLATDPAFGATVAFQVLPVIILVSAISGIGYHFGIVPAIVRSIAWAMRKTLKTSGAETFATGLLIVLGIESMTAVRAYLKNMTDSELLTVMTAFMATIAGSVMIVYASFGAEPGHLLTASLMSAPASFVISKLIRPPSQRPVSSAEEKVFIEKDSHNVIDAASRGASDGLHLALNVCAMLITFLGLVFIVDTFLGGISRHLLKVVGAILAPDYKGLLPEQITLKSLFGLLFSPFALLMGVPRTDILTVGQLLGTKTVLNEFLAYIDLQSVKESLQPRSYLLSIYALCGFANPGSLGILIAGMTGLAPERRKEIVQLGPEAFIAGTLACFMTACVVGVLMYE